MTLTPKQKEASELYLRGKTSGDIAKQLGKHRSTIQGLLRRAKVKLDGRQRSRDFGACVVCTEPAKIVCNEHDTPLRMCLKHSRIHDRLAHQE